MLEMASVARCLTSGVTMDGQPITFAGSRAAEARTAHQGREWRSAAPHFQGGKASREHSATATSKGQPECSKELSTKAARHMHSASRSAFFDTATLTGRGRRKARRIPSGVPLLKPQVHDDWASQAADSFRYLAMTLDGKAARSGFHRRLDHSQHVVGGRDPANPARLNPVGGSRRSRHVRFCSARCSKSARCATTRHRSQRFDAARRSRS
jgi:hypothetical protein